MYIYICTYVYMYTARYNLLVVHETGIFKLYCSHGIPSSKTVHWVTLKQRKSVSQELQVQPLGIIHVIGPLKLLAQQDDQDDQTTTCWAEKSASSTLVSTNLYT